MASKKLAEMNFDEFVDGALDNESGISTDNSESSRTKTKTKISTKSKVQRHKADLSKLADEDPDFYAYLVEHDKELLDFDVSDEGSGTISQSDSEDSQVEVVSETDSELEDESDASSKGKLSDDHDDDVGNKEVDTKSKVTKKQIVFLAKALTTKNSISTFKQAANLFHIAVHQVAGVKGDTDSEKLQFEKVTTFNELVSCCLTNIPIFLKNQLVFSGDVISIRGKNCRKIWSKLREPTKKYLSDLIFTLEKLTESSLLCTTVASTQPLVRLFMEFRKIRKQYVKMLIKLWSKDDRSVQLQSFLCMKATIIFSEYSLFTLVLKRSYLAYVQSTKFSSEQTKGHIAFLTDSLVELYSLDPSRGYQLAFVYIRQLAIHLRNAIISKTDETTRLVYNWQFIHCIEFWCHVLSAEGTKGTNMHQLIFPLVQVTLGAISLNPIVKFYPLRFRCIRALNNLSMRTDTYIPSSNYILETLDYTRSITKQAPMPPKPPNFHFNLKISKQFLKSKQFLDYTVEQAFELLLEHLSTFEHSIAFPEMGFPILLDLKKFAKATKSSKHRREVKSLIEKVEKQSKFIEDSRFTVDFAPKDIEKVREWEKDIATKQSNLKDYLILWRKTAERLFENQENGDKDADDEVKPLTNVKHKKSRSQKAPIEQESSSNSEVGSDLDDRVTDLSLDTWDD